MLRRGYDVFFHYANFGIRTLHLRLPYGLPDPRAAAPYLGEEFLQFLPDQRGPGGILAIEPHFEAGALDELWELDQVLGRLLPLRAEILDGDLRPLYLAHLAIACDGNHDPDETTEAPVPAGLQKPTHAQRALMQYLGLNDALVAAAAREAPPPVASSDARDQFADWLRRQPAATKDEWLVQWMTDPHSAARKEMLAEFQQAQDAPLWPTANPARTVAELMAAATEVRKESDRKEKERAARERVKRLAGMAADPDRTLRKTEQLVSGRSREAYHEIATLLADLREALAGSERAGLAERQAQSLRAQNPTLRVLISELRGQGLLPK